MTAEEVRNLVEREIACEPHPQAHGHDVRRGLVPPQLRDYADCGAGRPLVEPPPVIRLWLVWEEPSAVCRGYQIVFDDAAGEFGLAVEGDSGRDVFIGYYGTFLETCRGM